MQTLVVVGLQWGDEGKGKVIDYLSEHFDIVVRFQGGSNAGHTVVVGDQTYKFRVLPSGMIRGKIGVIGNGVVIDPEVIIREIDALQASGHAVRLIVSDRAHITTPFHIQLDSIQEDSRGDMQVGTTRRGIGPTYSDKASRVGVRVCDFKSEILTVRWKGMQENAETRIRAVGKQTSPTDSETGSSLVRYQQLMDQLSQYVGDCGDFLCSAIESGERVLFEGAQGTLLDIDHGTYPYVTSSNCVAAAASTGTGVPITLLDTVLGVGKAYSTRVGAGPFPTELKDQTGIMIQQRGGEIGTVTGRPRRCGWLDLVALRYATRLNGASILAITKLDVLTDIDPLRVCIAYEMNGTEIRNVPADAHAYSQVVPVYEELPGWVLPPGQTWRELASKGYDNLPSNLREYLSFIERETRARTALISLGPDRAETCIIERVLGI